MDVLALGYPLRLGSRRRRCNFEQLRCIALQGTAHELASLYVGCWSIDQSVYYEYEKENATPDELNRFQGEYMKQYSWAEVTLAKLYWENELKK